MPRPSHLPWFGHPINVWWSVQVMHLIMQFSPVIFSTSPLLGANILLSALFSDILTLCSFLSAECCKWQEKVFT
jgi:hypothetical protein